MKLLFAFENTYELREARSLEKLLSVISTFKWVNLSSMHYRVHRWLAVYVIKHTYGFQSIGVWGNTSLRRQSVNPLVVMVMGDCKAELVSQKFTRLSV